MPSPEPSPPSGRLARARRWLLRLVAAGALLVVVFLGACWLGRDWLTAKAGAIVRAQLEKRGIFLEVGRAGWAPIRGLVLADVAICPSAAKDRKLFTISDIAIALNPLHAVRSGEEGLSARITSRSGTLVAYADPASITVTDLDLTLRLRADGVEIDRLRALAAGHRLDLRGQIAFGPADPNAEPGQDPESRAGLAGLDLEPVARIISLLAVEPGADPPQLSVRLDRAPGEALRAQGRLEGESFSWHGARLDSLDLRFETVTGEAGGPDGAPAIVAIAFPEVELGRGGGSLSASGAYGLETGIIRLDTLDSSIDLRALIGELVPGAARSLEGVRLTAPPHLTLAGEISTGQPAQSELAGRMEGAAFEIALENGRLLAFSEIASSLRLSGAILSFPDLRAAVLGGSATFAGAIRPFDEEIRVDGRLVADGLSIRQLGALAGESQTGPGSLHGTFEGGGAPSLTGLDGAGRLRVSDAQPVSLPQLRIFLGALGKVIPGIGQGDNATTVEATYTLRDGILTSNDIALQSGIVASNGTARVDFNRNYITATATARTAGVSGLITGLAGKALEMQGEGPFGEVKWSFKNLSGLGDGTGIVVDGTKGFIEGAKGVGGGILKGVGGAAKQAGEAVTSPGDKDKPGLGDGLKRLLPGGRGK